MTKSKFGESRASVYVRQHFPTNNVRDEAFRRHPFAHAAALYIFYDSIQPGISEARDKRTSFLPPNTRGGAQPLGGSLILILIHPRPQSILSVEARAGTARQADGAQCPRLESCIVSHSGWCMGFDVLSTREATPRRSSRATEPPETPWPTFRRSPTCASPVRASNLSVPYCNTDYLPAVIAADGLYKRDVFREFPSTARSCCEASTDAALQVSPTLSP